MKYSFPVDLNILWIVCTFLKKITLVFLPLLYFTNPPNVVLKYNLKYPLIFENDFHRIFILITFVDNWPIYNNPVSYCYIDFLVNLNFLDSLIARKAVFFFNSIHDSI